MEPEAWSKDLTPSKVPTYVHISRATSLSLSNFSGKVLNFDEAKMQAKIPPSWKKVQSVRVYFGLP